MSKTPAYAIPDHTAPYTAYDLLDLDDGWHRFEVLDGALLVSPPPPLDHQRVADRLRDALNAAAPRGVEVITAVGVRLREDGTGFVPDVAVARKGARGPLLEADEVLAAVEVVSQSSRSADRVTKPAIYAKAGIPCYWRVERDPFPDLADDALPVVLVHTLESDCYRVTERLPAGTVGQATKPFPVTFDPAHLVG